MKAFIKAAFKISLFQTFIILFFSALKYVLVTYQLEDKIQQPFIWACFGAAIWLLIAVSSIGVIENWGETYEHWRAKTQKTGMEKSIAAFVTWGLAIPVILAYPLFFYVIAPTSWFLFLVLYAGVVIRNIIQFFSKKGATIDPEPN